MRLPLLCTQIRMGIHISIYQLYLYPRCSCPTSSPHRSGACNTPPLPKPEDVVAAIGEIEEEGDVVEPVYEEAVVPLGTWQQVIYMHISFSMNAEYRSEGLVSTMVDVYSFGILLMEVFSRRKPTEEMFSGELTLKRWMFESYPNPVIEIVDSELLNADDESIRYRHESCLTSIIGLALCCFILIEEIEEELRSVLLYFWTNGPSVMVFI
ncbi:hypothetical protein ACS0TY_027329 [Phlomoides rotata]